MDIRCNIPKVMGEALKRLVVDCYPGTEEKALWTKLVEKHMDKISSHEFVSITSRILDDEFYTLNYQQTFPLHDKVAPFFKTARHLKLSRGADGAAIVRVRSNNGQALREVLYQELTEKGYMTVVSGKVAFDLSTKRSGQNK